MKDFLDLQGDGVIPILYETALIALTLKEWSYHYKANEGWLNLAHLYKEMLLQGDKERFGEISTNSSLLLVIII